MTEDELAAIRARWANATAGGVYRADLPVDVLAEAFAHAPQDVVALLAEVDRLEATCQRQHEANAALMVSSDRLMATVDTIMAERAERLREGA